MNRSQIARVVTLCCFIAAGWGVAWLVFTMRNLQRASEASDTASLLGQYASVYAQTGDWPDANKPYGTYYHLVKSIPSQAPDESRTDIYESSSRNTWLSILLMKNGHMYLRILGTYEDAIPPQPVNSVIAP